MLSPLIASFIVASGLNSGAPAPALEVPTVPAKKILSLGLVPVAVRPGSMHPNDLVLVGEKARGERVA